MKGGKIFWTEKVLQNLEMALLPSFTIGPHSVDNKHIPLHTNPVRHTSTRLSLQPLSAVADSRLHLEDQLALRLLDEEVNVLNTHIIASRLQECVSLTMGKQLHARVVNSGLQQDVFLANLLVRMYHKCGLLDNARLVFNKMHRRTVVSWNTMITACSQDGKIKEAVQIFRQMQQHGVNPNKIAFKCALCACAMPQALAEGMAIHADIVDRAFDTDVTIGNTLITMYGKCGALVDAYAVFEEMCDPDVVSWTAMITAYCQQDHDKQALQIFKQMGQQGIEPNEVTFTSILGACANPAALPEGKTIHLSIVANGIEAVVLLGNALISMYDKCGSLEDAGSVFDKMHHRNVASWNAMISAYSHHGHGQKALHLFQHMQEQSVEPNEITFLCICPVPAALDEGNEIYAAIVDYGFESNLSVRTALVNMYSNCGAVDDASFVFDSVQQRDIVLWTAMIKAYSQNGHGKKAVQLFSQMQLEGWKPNSVTFVGILSACSHAGLTDEGFFFFNSMVEAHGITPELDHFSCIIDILGRAGRVHEAEAMVNRLIVQPDAPVWRTLLGACRIHGDVERAERIAEHLLDLDPQDVGTYRLLSNIYAADGRWDDVDRVREAMVVTFKEPPG